jgi:succinoglycan biosynthesis protein ExoO
VVSVIVANHNGGRYLTGAVRSALRQTLSNVEVIIIDDASTDDSRDIALDLAERDSRVRVLLQQNNAGPAAARNAGLAAAQGTWIAILDSDDFMHPERLAWLVQEAETGAADICADDLVVFGEGRQPRGHLSQRLRNLRSISLSEFIATNALYSSEPTTGYLKPLMRRSFLQKYGIVYDTALKIGEDFDLVARALAAGARFRLVDRLGYFYRKHVHSTSHRLSPNDIYQMLDADHRLKDSLGYSSPELVSAFQRRQRSLKRALEFDRLVLALKAKAWGRAISIAFHRPDVVPMLRMPLGARLAKLKWPRRDSAFPATKRACLISRQRIIGPTNGSSTYILGLCRVLRESGYEVTLISPNPGTLGRLPVFRLGSEMSVFNAQFLRGAWKFGSFCIAKDPRIAFNAGKAILARIAKRAGLNLPHWDIPAPYVIGSPWSRDELLYVSQHAPQGDLILADYAFATPAIPFALNEDARSVVIMHDLLSTRADRFKDAGVADSVKTLDEASEARLLGQADAVIAIQDVEAQHVRKLLPGHPVILSPVACPSGPSAMPGCRSSLLFVGSNTAPNVIGLRWFLESVWPQIRAEIPHCELIVAGGVNTHFPEGAPQTRFLGIVPDLSSLYEAAGVVISPLTIGSGLKVKVIEALGRGKAIVATSVSVEGIGEDVCSALDVCDEPSAFARSVCAFLCDDERRARKAGEALRQFKQTYSREACLRDFLKYVQTRPDMPSYSFERHELLPRQVEGAT